MASLPPNTDSDYCGVPLHGEPRAHRSTADILWGFRLVNCDVQVFLGQTEVARLSRRPNLTVPLAALWGEDVWLRAEPLLEGEPAHFNYNAARLQPTHRRQMMETNGRWCGGSVSRGRYIFGRPEVELCEGLGRVALA